MELTTLSATDVLRDVRETLSVSPSSDALSADFLAASTRRAASIMCPTTPRALITAVEKSLAPLVSDDNVRQRCRETLDELIAHGDLMEFDQVVGNAEEHQSRLVYVTPPCFVKVSDTRLFILGVAPDAVDPLPAELSTDRSGVVRSLSFDDHTVLREQLLRAGLYELPYQSWVKSPTVTNSANLVSQFNQLVSREPPCGELEGLQVLDGAIESDWYRQRWVGPRGLNGTYIGTRHRKWGADLWCYVELENGEAQRMIDLPQGRTLERGCDQAWRLQCALDAERGKPQTYVTTAMSDGLVKLDIHLPCPAWLLRRWDSIGSRTGDGVFSFLFASADVQTETRILEQQLWMAEKQ